jgi:hypothetical protein
VINEFEGAIERPVWTFTLNLCSRFKVLVRRRNGQPELKGEPSSMAKPYLALGKELPRHGIVICR